MREHGVQMAVDHEPRAHDWLVSRLVEADVRAIAAEACARIGIAGREEQDAYCLIALAGKADAPRRSPDGTVRRPYDLDPDGPDFRARLASWARTVAHNMHMWADDYEAIHDEADRFEIGTLRRLIRLRADDDVIDVLADAIAAVLTAGPRLDEMSIDHARELEPSPAQYAFQTALPQWIGTFVRRRRKPDADPLDGEAEERAGVDVLEQLDAAADVAAEGERAWVKAIASLAATRGVLAEAIERADGFELALAQRTPARLETSAAFARIRAELASVAGELSCERRAVTPMLSYVVLAMRSAPQLMDVSVLSLRKRGIDRAAIDAMAETMRKILVDDRHPTPKLIQQTRSAIGVSRRRVTALEELDRASARRAVILAPVAERVNGPPAVVSDIDAIAAAIGSRTNIVRQNRYAAAEELAAVDGWFGRVFRRYTIGRK